MCVELDLTKPLVPEFNVEGQILSVAYESLVMVCQRCGRVGHRLEACRGDQEVNMDKEMEVETEVIKPDIEIEKEDMGGRWKTVTRARRPRSNVLVTREFQRASRFNVLMEEERAGEQSPNDEGSQQQFQRKSDAESVQKEGGSRSLKKPVFSDSLGVINRRLDGSGPPNLAKKVQEGKQNNWVGGNNGLSNGDKGSGFRKNKDVNPVSHSFERMPENFLFAQKCQGVRPVGKENLNPGDYAAMKNDPNDRAIGNSGPMEGRETRTEMGGSCKMEGRWSSNTAS
ncbi:hypothetical protein K1719_041420 [Acacia pycnantha]|nr:hypothetical protein K1719_041420 [Acacia pycnantha]